MGPSIVNCILDGLEKVVDEMLQSNKNFKSWLLSKKLKVGSKYAIKSTKNFRVPARFLFVRVGSDILILSEGTLVVFNALLKSLIKKLKEKGLVLKDISKPILEFKSDAYFDYLGFRFFCKGSKKEKLILSRLLFKNYKNSLWVVNKEVYMKSIDRFVVSIQPEFFRNCCARIRGILVRSNSRLFVDEVLRQYNFHIRSIVNYFGITFNTRNQLRYLDNLSYC